MSENNASAKPWGTTVHNRMSITRCSLKGCGDYNWAEMREQLDRELGRGYAAAIADVVAWHRREAKEHERLDPGKVDPYESYNRGREAHSHSQAADAIERGEAKGAANE